MRVWRQCQELELKLEPMALLVSLLKGQEEVPDTFLLLFLFLLMLLHPHLSSPKHYKQLLLLPISLLRCWPYTLDSNSQGWRETWGFL